jgi:hypothetical protein
MPSETYRTLYRLIETLPVVSSHEHHRGDDFQRQLTLNLLIEKSYVGWRGLLPGVDPASRSSFLAQCRHSSYYVWLEKGIQRVHGFSEKITADNWDDISARISRTHAADPAAHIDILRNVGRYRRAVQDTYWEYGSDIGHPELFSPTMRTDMFVRCFHPAVRDHDDNNPFEHYPDAPRSSFADYLDFLEALFTRWRKAGAVTLKSASAYERPLAYGAGDRAAAAAVFGQPPEIASAQARGTYEEFMFNWFCELALKLDVPFQIHTGLGQLTGSRPLLFESTIARYPQLHFVLFHMGYPWYHEIAGLAHNYANVSMDMVWGPIISPTAAVAALHQYLEVARSSDLIAWGSDTWTSEDAVGALLAWQYVVATVLAQKVDDGYFDMAESEVLAHKLMYRNAARIYGFDAR